MKKENIFRIYAFIYIALFIIATVMKILDYFQIIVDRYSSNIIFFLGAVHLLIFWVSSIKEKNMKKRVLGAFLILISSTWFIVHIFHLFT